MVKRGTCYSFFAFGSSFNMPTLSNLHELEAQRQQLLSQKQTIVKAHNQQLAKIHTQLNRIKQQQQQMQQRQMQQQKQQKQQDSLPQPQKKKKRAAHSSQAKAKVSSADDWTCECGNVMGGSRARCGKCRRWKGGKREKKWKNSAGETNASLRATSSSALAQVVTNTEVKQRSSNDKPSNDDATVSQDDAQAAASLLSLRIIS